MTITFPRVEPPAVPTPSEPTDPIARLNPVEKLQVRLAAAHAQRLYQGPVGQLLSRELLAWEEFGFRLGDSALMTRLAARIHEEWRASGL